jgi:hypothetical protein
MKKILNIMFVIAGISLLYSCDDFLERQPLDQISEDQFWKTEGELQLYMNEFYDGLPSWSGDGTGYSSIPDNNTDVALYTTKSSRLDGAGSLPASGGGWDWGNVRNINYFLANVDKATGVMKDHYKGEGYFFRARIYYGLLQSFGALPIIDKPLEVEDVDYLYAPRAPRNEVVDFIVSNLDSAIMLLKPVTDAPAMRVNRDIALLYKTTVCLYEGTWEKYHQGDPFGVPGEDGSKYLQLVVDAATELMNSGHYQILMGDANSVYYELFNQTDLSGNPEIMMWRMYDYETYGGGFGNDVALWPNRSGITREMVRTYLCADGLPIALSPLYQGDDDLRTVTVNRDPRCVQSIMTPGDIMVISDKDTTFYVVPELNSSNYCPTGYEWQKYRKPETNPGGAREYNLAKIIYRYAEVLLNYAEAKAELGQLNQADLDMTINVLRDRVGMPHLVLGSITPDPDWPDWGYELPDYLQEIRRERIVEMLGEGFRFADLMRWRAHSLIRGKRPRGTKYTDELKAENPNFPEDAEGYIDPYFGQLIGPDDGYGFEPGRDYLKPLPIDQLTLNENLVQNPGWEE